MFNGTIPKSRSTRTRETRVATPARPCRPDAQRCATYSARAGCAIPQPKPRPGTRHPHARPITAVALKAPRNPHANRYGIEPPSRDKPRAFAWPRALVSQVVRGQLWSAAPCESPKPKQIKSYCLLINAIASPHAVRAPAQSACDHVSTSPEGRRDVSAAPAATQTEQYPSALSSSPSCPAPPVARERSATALRPRPPGFPRLLLRPHSHSAAFQARR